MLVQVYVYVCVLVCILRMKNFHFLIYVAIAHSGATRIFSSKRRFACWVNTFIPSLYLHLDFCFCFCLTLCTLSPSMWNFRHDAVPIWLYVFQHFHPNTIHIHLVCASRVFAKEHFNILKTFKIYTFNVFTFCQFIFLTLSEGRILSKRFLFYFIFCSLRFLLIRWCDVFLLLF